MTNAVRRIVFAIAGGAGAAGLVSLVEAGAAAGSTDVHGATYRALVLADLAVLVPVALLVGGLVAAFAIFLEPSRSKTPAEHFARQRSKPVLQRARDAALAPLVIVGTLLWCVALAHAARGVLAEGAPLGAGASLAGIALGGALVVGLAVLALVRPLRRALAWGAQAVPALLDPVTTAALALAAALGTLAWGIHAGDTGGEGGTLEIFGVLKRSELDLRPLINLLALGLGSYLAQVAFGRRRTFAPVAMAFALVLLLGFVTVHEARALNEEPATARAVARDAPLGKIALGALRQVTDRDRDGASPWFGGGDCDDRDPRRSPLAIDLPDNQIDEDCSGADLHLERHAAPAKAEGAPAAARPRVPPDLNVLFITVDTLRPDLGFMGYPKPTSPNLDALAAKSVVFDRMYSLASYTGKSIGPLFIGKYPSETRRDWGHFNTYLSQNTFVAERFKAAGVHTLGAASHWYFEPWSGLSQGMETWDLRAMPAGGQGDNDTSITSKELSDRAIYLLGKPEHSSKRFFMWLHYFDPHEQYMPHDGAPDFGTGSRAAYDGEVWFTDKHIGRVLDYIASQPWGERTAIVLTADHGEMFGEHGMRWHGYELWEGLVRVPFVVYVPGVAAHHVPVKRSHVDVVPTLLDLMNVWRPAEGELSGESMIDDVMAQPSSAGTAHDYVERDVYIDMPPGPFTAMRHALIHGTTPGMKLVHNDSGQYQLFDLAADPDEKEDLSSDAARLADMVGRFQAKRGSLHEIEVKPAPTTAP